MTDTAQKLAEEAKDFVAGEWPASQDFTVKHDMASYPIDALPDKIRLAVQEVQSFVQSPIAIVASAALSAVSVVSQGLADVRRAECLSGPSSLYFLSIAESGERKTSCDTYFLKPIHDWEARQTALYEPILKEYEANIKIWDSKMKGLQAKITAAARSGKSSLEEENKMNQLQATMPKPPRVPRLIFGDTTPEALAWSLSTAWPSGGVISSEAGIIFGGHGMGKDSVMRNLALLNVLWDGGRLKVDRRTKESFEVRNARLTMGLAVQHHVVREFFDNSKGLARGIGFAARFLISWPESTQGDRPFKESGEWYNLSVFQRQLESLLGQQEKLNKDNGLDIVLLTLSEGAKETWVKCHDFIEAELKPDGEMADVRDVASKAADNVARMAALFHIFENGPAGIISENHMASAAKIIWWHLCEARRFLGEVALPLPINNAKKLDAWLLKRFADTNSSNISVRNIQNGGPNSLRRKGILNDAISELIEMVRVRQGFNGRQAIIEINPALLSCIHNTR